MSATNLTKNLKLSQFVASDKPSWLGDVNGDNKKIDDGYGVLAGEISKANDTASSAKSQSDANTQTLTNVNSELEDYGNRITALEAGGGTEQLEQRVNTLSTDVEALQTRADTFDGDISQNGTDITALKGRVDTIEPKVKANADNITVLNNTAQGLIENINDLTTKVDEAKNLANDANTKAVVNEGQINTLKNSLNGVNSQLANKAEFKQYGLGDSKISGASYLNTIKIGTAIYFIPFYAINNSGNMIVANDSALFSIALDEFSSIITETIGRDFQVSGLVGVGNASFYWKIESNKLLLCCSTTINNGNTLSIQMPNIYIRE